MGRLPIPLSDPINLTKLDKQREAVRKYQKANREKLREKSKEFRRANPEYFKLKKEEEKQRIKNDPEYRKRELATRLANRKKNKDKILARAKEYYKAHYEERKEYRKRTSSQRVAATRKWQIENEERYKQAQAEWRKDNMHIVRKHIAIRRARIMNATIGNPKEIAAWEKEWKSRETNTCEWCRMEFPTSECQSDHAEPLSLGGPHNLDNLVVACRFCNNKKRNKPLSKWLDILGRD